MSTTAPASAPPEDARCLDCGYALRGLTTPRCPECGRGFDPSNPWSMDVGRPMPRFVVVLAGPIGPWARRALLIACGAILWGSAWMPGARFVEMLGWCAAGAIVCYTLSRRILRAVARHHYIQPPLRLPASERFRIGQVLLVLLAISSPLFWWPLRVSLLVQRPLLKQFAHYAYEQRPMSSPPPVPRMIGGFVVDEVWVAPNSITLHVLGGGMLRCSPDGRPREFSWLQRQGVPWYYTWVLPPMSGNWASAPDQMAPFPVLYR